jgi:CcmD family protein
MKTTRRLTATLAVLTPTLALPTAALAQVFEKVRGAATDEVPAGPFVAIAYGFIWVAILAYVAFVARGVGRVRGELDDVRRKIDAASKR